MVVVGFVVDIYAVHPIVVLDPVAPLLEGLVAFDHPIVAVAFLVVEDIVGCNDLVEHCLANCLKLMNNFILKSSTNSSYIFEMLKFSKILTINLWSLSVWCTSWILRILSKIRMSSWLWRL